MFTQKDEDKILKCQGCGHRCPVAAVEKITVRPNGVTMTQYIPQIGSQVVETYVNETGAHIRPVLEYSSDAIKTALDVCKLCDRYKAR